MKGQAMPTSNRRVKRMDRVRRPVVAAILAAAMVVPYVPSRADITGESIWQWLDSATTLLRMGKESPRRIAASNKPQVTETAGQREARVSRISLCPRRLLMYAGEQHSLSPLPLATSGDPVHGVVFAYETSDAVIAVVATDGSVTAIKPGVCFVTAFVGQRSAKVKVEVRDGLRPLLTNAKWDAEHENDCNEPEQDPPSTSVALGILANGGIPAKPPFSPQLLPAPDNDPPPNVGDAAKRANAVGHPRFSPDLSLQASPASNDNQLGSYSFNLSIPIYGASGRGVGVDLSLAYISRVWTKDVATNTMVFDYEVGWPAPGFRLNYGRIIPNYNVESGDTLGDYLLIEADGTRTPLIAQPAPNLGLYRSNDGRYVEFLSTNNKLFLPNGTLVRYEFKGPNTLVPTSIRDAQGNSITIAYVASCEDALRVEPCTCGSGCTRPPKQAIKQITDTLGRIATFYYYANGALAEIRTAGYNGAPDRVAAKFYYETRTITYDFGSLTVAGAPAGGQVDVLKRVYFPETERGYIFGSYSGYGMFSHASMRMGMTDALDGTEIGYTEYTIQTSGTLSDSPQITARREWWQGKTDDAGTPTTSPATYTYSRTTDEVLKTMTNSVSGPAGPNSVTTVMVSDNDTFSPQNGLLKEQRLEVGGVVKSKQEFFYDNPASGQGSSGLQRNKVITTDDGSPANQTRTDFLYGQYGRLISTTEFGFPMLAGTLGRADGPSIRIWTPRPILPRHSIIS